MTECRPIKTIPSFEILSSTEWIQNYNNNFNPNFFIDLYYVIKEKIKTIKF